MQLPIVLIGPMCAGKSTVADALSRRLDLPQVPLDAVRYYYHVKAGMRWSDMVDRTDFSELVRFWQPYSIDAVERVLVEFPEAVIDFGAGHAHYEDEACNERLRAALEPVPHVVLLLPHEDPEEAARICLERGRERGPTYLTSARERGNRVFIESPVFRSVATSTVYTQGTVDEVVDRVLAAIGGPD